MSSQTKIVVDENKCIGCNTCVILDSDTFELDQNTYKAKIKNQPSAISPKTKNAIDSCPVTAITVKSI